MAKLILFSGPCNSGKTTTLNAVHDRLCNLGYRVEIIDELIRQKTDEPIDELRKNVHKYLKLQYEIIIEKIEQEKNAQYDAHDVIYLADRAVTDSLFYLENYVNKTELNEKEAKLYAELHSTICLYLSIYYSSGDNKIIMFYPLRKTEDDKYRPNNFSYLSCAEFECIKRLNIYYGVSHTYVNLNCISKDTAVEKIISFITK